MSAIVSDRAPRAAGGPAPVADTDALAREDTLLAPRFYTTD